MAGNPNAYPVEYYNKQTGEFEGFIPELLQQFSEQTGYDVRYYKPDSVDHRERWSDNRQVDLVSACLETDNFRHVVGQELVLLQTKQDGKTVTYGLYVTEAAPDMLADELRNFLSGTEQDVRTGLLVQSAVQGAAPRQTFLMGTAIALGILVLILAAVIAVMRSRHRRSLKESLESDEITGIGNIDHFRRYFGSYVHDQNRILYSMFYFHVDVDGLDQTAGREKTNEFLRYVAVTLQDNISDTDILGRVSDSGFAVLRLSTGQREGLNWLRGVLDRIYSFSKGISGEQAVAAGIYPLRNDDRDLDEIFSYARQGARIAYEADEEYRICNMELLQSITEERQLQEDIERGLEDEEFHLYILFYIDAVSGRIVGGEALSRWDHPTRGLLLPGRYISLMEREGLISSLDYYILDKACAFLEYVSGKTEDFFLSCNFSRDTFVAKDFVERCKTIVEQYNFPRERLLLEITDSSVVDDPELVSKNIRALKELGIQVGLDDFGGAHTSFMDIQTYSPNALKLHRNLVEHVTTDTGEAILRSLIRICHDLGITAMAEGVETDEQAQALRRLSCDVVQGYQFYQPLPYWEARKIILE